MKIKLAITIDIDPETYCEQYGIEFKDVRQDVKSSFENAVHILFENVRGEHETV